MTFGNVWLFSWRVLWPLLKRVLQCFGAARPGGSDDECGRGASLALGRLCADRGFATHTHRRLLLHRKGKRIWRHTHTKNWKLKLWKFNWEWVSECFLIFFCVCSSTWSNCLIKHLIQFPGINAQKKSSTNLESCSTNDVIDLQNCTALQRKYFES